MNDFDTFDKWLLAGFIIFLLIVIALCTVLYATSLGDFVQLVQEAK